MAFTATTTVTRAESGRDNKPRFEVKTFWAGPGVTRADGYGYVLGNKRTAQRLARAIEAGAAFPNPELREDVNGKFYVSHGLTVMGRRASADLKRLGF